MPHLGEATLRAAFRESAARRRGDIDTDEADALAAALRRSLVVAEEEYVKRLAGLEERTGRGSSEQRDQGGRLRALQVTISTMLEETERE